MKDNDDNFLKIFYNIEGKNFNSAGSPTENHFFNAFYTAWLTHGEIVLSPDDIWLQISMVFAEYVNDNSEKLRSKIVDFEGKKVLKIY